MIPDLIGVPPYLQVPIRGLGNNDAKDVRYSRVVYQVRNLGAPHETDSLLPPDIIAGIRDPAEEEIQADGRIRKWIWVEEKRAFLRIILLKDGETVHNAFFDRRYPRKESE